MDATTDLRTGSTGAQSSELPLLVALRGGTPERIPVWFMRQAGRSLPEYRALREQHGLLELVQIPELAAEVTLQPVRRYGVDAAVLFSDIVAPLAAVGVGVELRAGVGPVIDAPIRSRADVERLHPFAPARDAPWLAAATGIACAELTVPLVGFAGGPFTLASYLVEGGPSRTQARTKALMLSDPDTWRTLLERLSQIALASLTAQVRAGARAIQIFDSWVGSLSAEHFDRHVRPVLRALFDALAALDVPRIYFALGSSHLLREIARCGPDAISIDWRTPLDRARELLDGAGADRMALQGNLDPAACLAPWEALARETRAVLDRAPAGGYVFNLGHGVLPQTSPDELARVVELVHAHPPGLARS